MKLTEMILFGLAVSIDSFSVGIGINNISIKEWLNWFPRDYIKYIRKRHGNTISLAILQTSFIKKLSAWDHPET